VRQTEALRRKAGERAFVQGETQFGVNMRRGTSVAGTGLCMNCALRRHDFHEVLGRSSSDVRLPETPLPQGLIDGRPYVLVSHAWTHQQTCGECGRKAAALYLPVK
jgi:hypothetical protein